MRVERVIPDEIGHERPARLACSLTATLDKIEADAKKINENFGDVKVLIFATPQKITNHTASTWADSVREKFGYDFIAHTPPFRSRSNDGGNLASLYMTEHFSFLLNGWNEISETYSEEAPRAPAQLERSFPAAGIIVATRTHHISPPLPGSFRAKLLPLNRAQRTVRRKPSRK